jgi:predicted MFS family arabinose efflux permease
VAAPAAPAQAGTQAGERYWAALRGGFQFLWRDRVLSVMLTTVFALNAFSYAANVVFLPVWADKVLHSPEALGLTLGMFAAGTLLGTLVLGVLAPRLPQYLTFLLGALIAGAPRLLVLGLTSHLPLVLVVSFIGGFGLAAVNPILGVAMYERIPERLQARVIGLCTTVCFAGLPIGTFFGGWSVSVFGLRSTLIGAAIGCLLLNVAPLLGRRDLSLAAQPAPTVAVEPAQPA